MNKDAIYDALRIVENATNFEDLRHSLIIICNELLSRRTNRQKPTRRR